MRDYLTSLPWSSYGETAHTGYCPLLGYRTNLLLFCQVLYDQPGNEHTQKFNCFTSRPWLD
jgi:hypothetical protein